MPATASIYRGSRRIASTGPRPRSSSLTTCPVPVPAPRTPRDSERVPAPSSPSRREAQASASTPRDTVRHSRRPSPASRSRRPSSSQRTITGTVAVLNQHAIRQPWPPRAFRGSNGKNPGWHGPGSLIRQFNDVAVVAVDRGLRAATRRRSPLAGRPSTDPDRHHRRRTLVDESLLPRRELGHGRRERLARFRRPAGARSAWPSGASGALNAAPR